METRPHQYEEDLTDDEFEHLQFCIEDGDFKTITIEQINDTGHNSEMNTTSYLIKGSKAEILCLIDVASCELEFLDKRTVRII